MHVNLDRLATFITGNDKGFKGRGDDIVGYLIPHQGSSQESTDTTSENTTNAPRTYDASSSPPSAQLADKFKGIIFKLAKYREMNHLEVRKYKSEDDQRSVHSLFFTPRDKVQEITKFFVDLGAYEKTREHIGLNETELEANKNMLEIVKSSAELQLDFEKAACPLEPITHAVLNLRRTR